jgi:hypothetical protein
LYLHQTTPDSQNNHTDQRQGPKTFHSSICNSDALQKDPIIF